MTRPDASPPILRSLVLLLVAAVWSAPARAGEPTLAGTVRDAVGGLLSGVEILFVRSNVDTFVPTAVVQSDKAGTFRVDQLAPGVYRYAALKQGYRTLVGQVDTMVEDSIHLVLRPAESVDDADRPKDASWVLRLPRRGMLNDTEPLLVPETLALGAPIAIQCSVLPPSSRVVNAASDLPNARRWISNGRTPACVSSAALRKARSL